MKMDEVIGQEGVKSLLLRQIEENRVPHAQLFCGPAGSGKLPMALAFAQTLLCQQRQGLEPCGHCNDCAMASHFAHPDLHFIFPIYKKSGNVKALTDTFLPEWRDLLSETVWIDREMWNDKLGIDNQQPVIYESQSTEIIEKLSLVAQKAGGYKVVIVWQADKMNESCANKLLKTLEEPIGRTAFILVSDQPEKLLPTILSRVQHVDFPALRQEDIEQALTLQRGLTPEDARTIARSSNGNYTLALQQLMVDADAAMYFDMFVLLMRRCYMRDIRELSRWSETVSSWGRERQKHFLDYCQRLIRENFIYNFHQAELNYETRKESDFSRNFARFVNERNVIGIMDELSLAQRDIEANVNPNMVFFDFCLKMIVLLIK